MTDLIFYSFNKIDQESLFYRLHLKDLKERLKWIM